MKVFIKSKKSDRSQSRNAFQKGFSLIELLIAMVIFLIVTGAIYGLMEVGRIDRNRASRRSDVLKNARVAIHLIGRDVLNAGWGYHRIGAVVPDNFNSNLLGVPPDVDGQRDLLTSMVAGDNIYTNTLNPTPGARTDMVAFVYRDVDFNGGNVIDLQGAAAVPGDATAARLTTKTAIGAAAAQPYDLFLIESDSSQVAVMATAVNGADTMDFAPIDPLGLNQPFNGAGVNGSLLRQCISSADTFCTNYLATAKRIFLVSYKVQPNGTLVRTIYGNNRGAASAAQIRVLPLAYNVSDLQIRYVLDDGTLTSNPSVGVGWQGFNRIRQINITLTVMASENDEKTGKPEAITLNATFSTRNMEYDAG